MRRGTTRRDYKDPKPRLRILTGTLVSVGDGEREPCVDKRKREEDESPADDTKKRKPAVDDSSFMPQRLAAARDFMSPTMNPGCDPKMAHNMASIAMIAPVEECENCKSKGINPVPSGPMITKCKCGIYFG